MIRHQKYQYIIHSYPACRPAGRNALRCIQYFHLRRHRRFQPCSPYRYVYAGYFLRRFREQISTLIFRTISIPPLMLFLWVATIRSVRIPHYSLEQAVRTGKVFVVTDKNYQNFDDSLPVTNGRNINDGKYLQVTDPGCHPFEIDLQRPPGKIPEHRSVVLPPVYHGTVRRGHDPEL